MTTQRIYRLPEGIATKAEFFAAVIDTFPLDPPLSDERQVWDALSDSLFQGLMESPDAHIAIIWPDPAMADARDFETAANLLRGLVGQLHGSKAASVDIAANV